MNPNDSDDDLVIEEDGRPPRSAPARTWKVLIVDDDDEVHQSTVFALKGETVIGRPLEFLHAHSAAEATTLLGATGDIAVALLDVVMEQVDSGLTLVRTIRETLGRSELRIILRTGQPGYAPETDAIRLYDINDYRTKSELTHGRLLTSITAAIRSYEQIRSLSRQRRGLEMIVDASPALTRQPEISSFAEGVIIQIGTLLHIEPEGIVCVRRCNGDSSIAEAMVVVGATGRHRTKLGCRLGELEHEAIFAAIERCVAIQDNIFSPNWTALYIRGEAAEEGAVFVDTCSALEEADRQLLAVFCTNIAAGLRNTQLMQELNETAYFDKLTGLPNRSRFVADLQTRLADPASLTVAIVDVNRFAELNVALGHRNGDRLIRETGERLRRRLPERCLVARVSGDSFAVAGSAEFVNPRLLGHLFNDPFRLPDGTIDLSVTIGLVERGEIAGDAMDVLKAASIALHRAKGAKRGRYEYYSSDMETAIRSRLGVSQELRQALRIRGLSVHYQPQTDLASGRAIGVEALVRWDKGGGQFVPPDHFIPIAEQTGLIVDLGEFVLAESVRQLVEWHRQGRSELRMAVNVSMAQFKSRRFLPYLEEVLEASGVDRSRLELEITESMIMNDVEKVIDTLTTVRSMGLSVAIDDFGTGFSSLGYLQRLPIDRLKVDRSFVRDLGQGGRGETIAQMVVQLGKTLGLTIIGEGIETGLQRQILGDWGCHEGQGYLWSPPLTPEAFESWLSDRGE